MKDDYIVIYAVVPKFIYETKELTPEDIKTTVTKYNGTVGLDIGSTTYTSSEYNSKIKKDDKNNTYLPYTRKAWMKDVWVKLNEGYTVTKQNNKYKVDWHSGEQLYKLTTSYAKGTLGTTKDEFAITDESWIGEEITLAAGKNGQLQYLKKGSAVMPADISANLVEWGKINPNMMNIGGVTDGINLMSSYINKPEIKLDIENFLNVGTVSRDTLPELEKLMDKKIDTFAKQLNASIRKFK